MIEVAAGVIVREGKVLLANRREGENEGLWEFPGGKKEKGEGIRECLKRELFEELGIRVRVLDLICKEEGKLGEDSLALYFFICEIQSGEPRPEEGQKIVWVDPGELGSLRLSPLDRGALKKIQEEVEEHVQKEKGCRL